MASSASAAATAGHLTAPLPMDTATHPPPEYGQLQFSVSSNAFNFVK